jgi:hypothetical protein
MLLAATNSQASSTVHVRVMGTQKWHPQVHSTCTQSHTNTPSPTRAEYVAHLTWLLTPGPHPGMPYQNWPSCHPDLAMQVEAPPQRQTPFPHAYRISTHACCCYCQSLHRAHTPSHCPAAALHAPTPDCSQAWTVTQCAAHTQLAAPHHCTPLPVSLLCLCSS